MKIMMNHLQLILLTSSFEFDWPGNVEDFYDTTKPASQVSTQFLSFDCFLDNRESDEESNVIRLYWQKMLMFAALPLIFALSCYLFWSIYFCNKKNKKSKYGRIIACIIILFFLVHPNIVIYMFNSFNCTEIDGERRMLYELEVACWKSEHFRYCSMVALPSLVIWGFGIPLVAWIVLARNKDSLESVELREKYGFLYNGYKKKYYYWESVIMYRKIAIIFISVFLESFGVITQALVVFIVLILFLILNIKLKPFTFEVLNDMEMMSIITSILTVYCGLFYLSDQSTSTTTSTARNLASDSSNDLNLSFETRFFLFLIIIISNMLFFSYWAYKMVGEIKNQVRTKFKKVYLYIF